jgi:hypothetical protein
MMQTIAVFLGISLLLNLYLGIKLVSMKKTTRQVIASTEELLYIWDDVSQTIGEIKEETNK